MQDIRNYVPEKPRFQIAPKHNQYPAVLFEGAKNFDEIKKLIAEKFIGINTGAKVFRLLDNYEITTIRANYSELMENDRIEAEANLLQIQAEAKAMVDGAKSRLQSIETQIDDLVSQVKNNNKEVELLEENSYRLTVSNHHLYYSWVGEEFTLTRVDEVPEWEMRDLFSQQDKNHAALRDMFGFDFSTGELVANKPKKK